ncbi:hypothetical protein [Saccharothrix sp. Mg75]|uniref:hypothetical protein n=1 Tax=Saccharothrix sp. Mg75 TaxID=3445357 RepID=UPI003EED4EC5
MANLTATAAARHDRLGEAHDATPDRTPVVGSSSTSLHRGNGMKIIQTICNDWGVRQGTDHKVVWGRIPMP